MFVGQPGRESLTIGFNLIQGEYFEKTGRSNAAKQDAAKRRR